MLSHLRTIRPGLMLVSVLSFGVSLVFTIKLLSSQATSGADKALFGGLALSSELGKIILFSVGMMLLFVFRNRRYSWIGVPLLIISLAFTVLSVVGTIGALQVSNAQKSEATIIHSDKYNLLKSQIESLDQQAKQLRATAAGQPSTWGTHNEAIQSAQKAEEEKSQLMNQLQNLEIGGTGAQNALYKALADWTGDTVENAKFTVMAAYGIGLEALALFCALFAFFGDYLLGDKNPIAAYEDRADYQPIQVDYSGQNAHIMAENQRLKDQLNALQLEAQRKTQEDYPDYDMFPKEEDRRIGLNAEIDDPLELPALKDYIAVAWQNIDNEGKDHLMGRSRIAKQLQIAKGKANEYHKILQDLHLIEVSGSKTYPLVSKQEMLENITQIVIEN